MSKNDSKVAVSIIMPCYNSERFIGEAIRSVVSQSFTNWELLICDDGSSDNSVSIIKCWAATDSRIRPVCNDIGKGAPSARNSCLRHAEGRYIAFLDSDDRWMSQKLETQLAQFRKENVVFSFSDYTCINEHGSAFRNVQAPMRVGFKHLLLSNYIGCLTAIYDSQYFGKVEQPQIKKRNDYALWLVMFRRFPDAYAVSIPESLAEYRVNSYGLSSNKLDAIRYYWRCIRQYGGTSTLVSALLLPCYLILISLKKIWPNGYNQLVRFKESR